MPRNPEQPTRRGFLRRLRPELLTRTRESGARAASFGEPNRKEPPKAEPASERQFRLRDLLFWTFLVAVFAALVRQDLVARPRVVIGSACVVVAMMLVIYASMALFDAFLWWLVRRSKRDDEE